MKIKTRIIQKECKNEITKACYMSRIVRFLTRSPRLERRNKNEHEQYQSKSTMPQPRVDSGFVNPVLLQGMIMVDRFIIQVCFIFVGSVPARPTQRVEIEMQKGKIKKIYIFH